MIVSKKILSSTFQYSSISVMALFSANLLAADINCGGEVTVVMDYPQHCEGNMAFKTEGSAGRWICPASDKSNALILAAVMSNKRVGVYIDSKSGSYNCSSLPSYIKARYVLVYQ